MRSVPSEKLKMVEGCTIEMSYNKNGGVWYKAIIVTQPPMNPKASRRELCVRLLKDGFSTPITKLNQNSKVFFRPVPPINVEARIDVKQGSIVDAVHKYEWWTGTLVKEIEDDKCLVLFDSPPDIIQFERKFLRPHLEWVDEKSWVIPGRNAQFLRLLNLEPMFCPGAMVEVRSKLKKAEVVWVPAMVIKEIEENDEKKYIVKFCNDPLHCKRNRKIPNKTIDLHSVRPKPASLLVEDYLVGEDVEVFHGSAWRQGTLKRRMSGFLSGKWFAVLLEATNEELRFKHSDIRPLMKLQDDGVWKHSREMPSTQGSGNKMVNSVMKAKESDPPASTSPDIAATPLKPTETETQRNQNCLRNDSAPENVKIIYHSHFLNSLLAGKLMILILMIVMYLLDYASSFGFQTPMQENNRDNDRKRKREEELQNISSVATVEETEANDTTMVLPFEKKLPIWKKVESMEIFKTVPQSPHFSPLVGTSEDSREVSAVGLMLTFSSLLEEVKDLQLDHPKSSLISLNASFAELEKHGFDVKEPQLRISKLLSLRDMQTKKLEELKDIEKVTAEKESVKVDNERKILELQRLILEAEKEIAQSKSCEATIVQQLEDVKFQFQTITSTPW